MTSDRHQNRNIRTLALGLLALWFLEPGTLRAQAAGLIPEGLDAWRARLNERLDRDLARLSAPQREPSSALTLGGTHDVGQTPQAEFSPRLGADGADSWLPTIAGILRAHGLPMMLVSVAAIESSFNPAALSPKGARGLWQLMPETARRFGLLVETQGDERLDPVKSTFAAARYLKELHAQFGDWPLALAAYNAGAERVQRSLERLGARDFWTLRRRLALPEETRRYVPTVLARAEGLLSAGNTEGSAPEWQPDSKPLSSTRIQPKVVYALTSPVP